MKSENDKNLMINMRLMKMIGLYQILSPNSPKILGINIFKYLTIIQLFIIQISAFEFISNIYFCWDNINEVTKYCMYLQSDVIATIQLYYVLKKSNEIWNCIRLTSTSHLAYKYHSRRIFEAGQSKSKSYSVLIMLLWVTLVVSWILVPYMVKNYYIEVNVENVVYRYRFSALNCLYPVTDKFYNEHFIAYYCVESIILMCWGHIRMIFDVLGTSMCITIAFQLKMIANSFSMLNITDNHSTNYHFDSDNATKLIECKESTFIVNFKVLVQDQQKVVENMKNIYRILRSVMLLQIALNSLTTILLCSITIMNYFNGLSLTSPMNIRLLMAIKESLNFALYSSGWTESSIKCKKILLLAMRLNNAEKLKLQITKKQIVNFELFTSIMQTTYSVSSLLVKQCSKKM
ncbi:uncharacterized protein LOC112685845 isoform X1 [Sipha flava]|uniref:Odorant receptor n=1 Tax=Sipha flava TaxID=143950 RepID=A0A8B8FT93_9HEMI|nr:uncharacterized protein LOC112685845 isoform X1 [Sipha flava]